MAAPRAGTILHRGPRPLEAFDPDLVDQLVKRTRELGIHVELGDGGAGSRPDGCRRGRARRDTGSARAGADAVRAPAREDPDADAAVAFRRTRLF